MSHISLRAIGKTAAAICLAVAMSGVAMAGDAPDRVVMQSPAKDAAVLAKMQGLVNNRKAKTLSGLSRTINDGVVIRKSTIKDGKIIIPPSGLYITVRSTNWHPFDNEPLTLAGKTYHAITDRYVRDVIRNVTMKKGQVLPSNANKSRGWELSSVENDTYGIEGGNSAVFKIVKTTGNYYGSQFPVYAGAQISNAAADGSLVKGSKDPEGHTVPTAENGLSEMIYGSNIATVGRTHVIIDAIEGDSVKVRELATDSCSAIFVSPNEPVVASYGKGDTFSIGDAKVEVTDVAANAATVKLTDKSGTVTKVLGPLTPENTRMLLMSVVDRDHLWTLSKDGKVAVHLNIRQSDKPIADGKVSLVAYTTVACGRPIPGSSPVPKPERPALSPMRSSLKTTRKSFSTGEPTTCLLVRTSISPLLSTNLTARS